VVNKSSDVLRVAVIGAGEMGRNHLRLYDLIKGVELIGVVDTSRERADEAAARHGCESFVSVEKLVGRVDAVSVATPSINHAETGTFLLENGVHCLIEKPLAVTEADCLRLIDAAERNGVVLLVGHVEHFNPAIRQLLEMFSDKQKIYAIDARRMSSASARIKDVDVVMDLMVHDLDIVLALLGTTVTDLSTVGIQKLGDSGSDYVSASLSFSGETVATLTASRITEKRIRELLISSEIGCVSVDYSAQTIAVHHQKRPEQMTSHGGYVFDLSTDAVLVRASEPLMLEIQHFIEAIRDGIPVKVSGRDALAALQLVWRIQKQLHEKNHETGE
jgi:predicted dehydrogenase